MTAVFLYAFHALSPILILVLFGYMLKIRGIFSQDFFKNANAFAFRYCFPFLMFVNLYSLGSLKEIDWALAGVLLFGIIVLTLIGLVVTNLVTDVRSRKGVLIQAAFRSNFAVIAVPLAEGLAGSQGIIVVSSMQAPVVIYFNIVSVLALAAYSDNAKFDLKVILKNLVKNPLLQGIGAGILVLILREFLPVSADGTPVFTIKSSLPWLFTVITYMSRMGTPLCLIALGGQFNTSDVPSVKKELITGTLMRLIMAPAIGLSIAFAAQAMGLLTLTPASIATLIAVFGSPIAVSSAAMAAQMEGDEVLAGQIVVWTSIGSMLTIFLLAVGFRAAGML